MICGSFLSGAAYSSWRPMMPPQLSCSMIPSCCSASSAYFLTTALVLSGSLLRFGGTYRKLRCTGPMVGFVFAARTWSAITVSHFFFSLLRFVKCWAVYRSRSFSVGNPHGSLTCCAVAVAGFMDQWVVGGEGLGKLNSAHHKRLSGQEPPAEIPTYPAPLDLRTVRRPLLQHQPQERLRQAESLRPLSGR